MNEKLNRQGLVLAIDRNELDEFLSGSGMYRLGYNSYAPGSTMLNLSPAMKSIYDYYIDEPEKRVDLELEKTLLNWLTWKSGVGVFAVFSVLSYQLKMEQSDKSPFNINKDKIIIALKEAINIYSDKLKNIKRYEGVSLNEGLWEAMQIEDKMNIDNYGIKIL
ncbi:hypothetical protein CSC2_12630 [Clostridium zeae]|uniref:Uncharacterized protein n=1 Tax=Clostridium zeae TaxID=2759022 RepID=A0ABQ1E7H0_9CLOT|nr:hypothetical protein [Clostridium zeae]GFZ30737.1 hypothetical protein CSC2_12630 [Clostridium zeae]